MAIGGFRGGRARWAGAWRRAGALALAAGALLVLPGVAQPAERTSAARSIPSRAERVEQLVRYFDTIVFETEFQATSSRPSIAKWEDRIRVSLHGRRAEHFRWIVKHHLDRLSAITKLRAEVLLPHEGTGNIAIHFVTPLAMETVPLEDVDPDLQSRLGRSRGCYFVSFRNPQNRIYRSEIVVNDEREERLTNHCLLEELTQSLGLVNDSDQLRPSVFSDKDVLLALPPTDVMLLKTLYHPDMRPGFYRVRAIWVARRIIAQLLAEQGAVAGTDDALPRDFRLIPRKPDAPPAKPR